MVSFLIKVVTEVVPKSTPISPRLPYELTKSPVIAWTTSAYTCSTT